MSRKVRSTLALLVLTLFLGTGAAHALPAEGPSLDRAPGMLVAIWEWVMSLWGGEGSLLPVHEAAGVNEPPPPPTTNGGNNGDGGYIDPNGGS
jgi:hypothetical protein